MRTLGRAKKKKKREGGGGSGDGWRRSVCKNGKTGKKSSTLSRGAKGEGSCWNKARGTETVASRRGNDLNSGQQDPVSRACGHAVPESGLPQPGKGGRESQANKTFKKKQSEESRRKELKPAGDVETPTTGPASARRKLGLELFEGVKRVTQNQK